MPLRLRPVLMIAIGPLALVLAFALRWLLWPVLGHELPFMFSWFAVVLAARYGGWQVGLLTTVLAALVGEYVLFEPRVFLSIFGPAEFIGIFLFVVMGVMVSFLIEGLHQARRGAEAYAQKLNTEYTWRAHLLPQSQRQASDRLDHLQKLITALAERTTREQVADTFLAHSKDALKADSCSLALWSDDGAEIVVRRSDDLARGRDQWQRLPAASAETLGADAVPIKVGGRVLGELTWSFSGGESLGEKDRPFVLMLAVLCGQALELVRLHQAT